MRTDAISQNSALKSIFVISNPFAGMTNIQRSYLVVFVLSSVVCWSPSKALPYVVPFVSVFWIFITTRKIVLYKKLLILTVIWGIWFICGFISNPDFIIRNGLLAIVTYGSFYLPFLIPSRYLSSNILYKRIAQILVIIIIFQSSVGLVQVVYGFLSSGSFDVSNGDYIEGTIDISLMKQPGFETPIFAINMAMTLIALLPFILIFRRWWWFLPFLFGTTILVLSSVLHALLFLLIAFTISFFFINPVALSSKRVAIAALFITLVLFLMLILMLIFLPTNLSSITIQLERFIRFENPKAILFQRLFSVVPEVYPLSPYVGLGPGQFTSRASLIGSGYYIGGIENPRALPYLRPMVSKAVEDYLLDLWRRLIGWPGSAGSTLRPFSSWLSVISEAGVIGAFIILFLLLLYLAKVKRHTRFKGTRIYAFSIVSGLLFLFLLGVQENYWEIPQSILVGCLLLKVLSANFFYGSKGTPFASELNRERITGII